MTYNLPWSIAAAVVGIALIVWGIYDSRRRK